MPKNITLAVDDDLLHDFRLVAASRRTSVNALIRDFMKAETGASALSERRRNARAWMAAKGEENMANDDLKGKAGWKWRREDCYSGPRFDRLNKI